MVVAKMVSKTLGEGGRLLLPPPLAALLVVAETAMVVCTVAKEVREMLVEAKGGD